MAGDGAVVAAVLERHGRTFAEEAGIDLGGGSPKGLFGLLELTLLLATRVQHDLALRAAAALVDARLDTPDRVLAAERSALIRALHRGEYVRYDESKADQLRDAARLVRDRYDGDLRQLRSAADADLDRLAALLQEVNGIGEVGAEIFLREVQLVWTEVRPFAGRAALAGAAALGLSPDPVKLAVLVAPDDLTRLMAALVRTDLADDAGELLAAARG